MNATRIVVVGAGPAGVRAAETLVRHGRVPVLLDEAARSGGQIYRRPPAEFTRPAKALYGFEAGKATALHRCADALSSSIDYRPNSLVWNAGDGTLDVMCNGHLERVAYDCLIIATGATDRVLPVPGWTLPGVYTLGAAQIALKFQGCAIGDPVVFAGTGPLLYLVAYQYAKAGARVAAVLDHASLMQQTIAVGSMLEQPATLAKGLYYRSWLLARGIAVEQKARLLDVQGERQVGAVRWVRDGVEHRTPCTALGFGYALRSETQLADLLGCEFEWSALNRAWLPLRDPAGRSSTANVYLAGDGAGVMGADAAEMAGERAALALLEDAGERVDAGRVAALEHGLARVGRFRQGLERAFPFPEQWAAEALDDLMLCRCEEISVGQLRAVVRDGAIDINRAKALCRVGMGRCQGRMCGAAAAEIIASESGRRIDEVGRLRGQAPIKPIPFCMECDE
ncbi:FAD/NAD(P)-dependent oxidoreductase [Pseudomonas sp. Marseille-QA0892]